MRNHSFLNPIPLLSRGFLTTHCGILLVCITGAVQAQDAAPAAAERSGIQIHSVTAYFDYYSTSLPNSGALQAPTKLGPDADGGASVQAGWSKQSERSSSSLTYTTSLTGRVRYSEWNSWNHLLSFNTSHKLAPRWTLGFIANGNISSRDQFQFSPTTLGSAIAIPVTFDDLASGVLSSRFTNPQLAAALNGVPLAQSPVRFALYGERVLTSGAQASLTYSYSSRLSFFAHASGGRMQSLRSNPDGSSVIPNTTSVGGDMGFSYSLSPRTHVGTTVTTTRNSSKLQDAYNTSSTANLGRTIARRWLIQIHGGVGVINPIRQQQSGYPSGKATPVAGGRLGFKTFAHTFLASFDRTVSDQYGLGSSATSTASGSWRWDGRGHAWWIESSFVWQQLYGNGFSNANGWHSTSGFGQRIGRHLAMLTQYSYVKYPGQVVLSAYNQTQSAARISLIWTAHPLI